MWREVYHEIRCWAKAWREASSAQRRTEITVETDRIWIVRRLRPNRVWCAECGREVEMVGPNEIAAISGARQPLPAEGDAVQGWHSIRAADGSPRFCLVSVLKSLPGE